MHCCILILQRTMKELYEISKDKNKSIKLFALYEWLSRETKRQWTFNLFQTSNKYEKKQIHQIICSLWMTFERNKKTMNFQFVSNIKYLFVLWLFLQNDYSILFNKIFLYESLLRENKRQSKNQLSYWLIFQQTLKYQRIKE